MTSGRADPGIKEGWSRLTSEKVELEGGEGAGQAATWRNQVPGRGQRTAKPVTPECRTAGGQCDQSGVSKRKHRRR